MIKHYYSLAKPGIIYGNILTVSAGYFLNKGPHGFGLYCLTLVGISLVMACGCVVNNYYDRDIDERMERTKNRVLVQGLISKRSVFVYAFLLGATGLLILSLGANILTGAIAAIGLFFYLVIYTFWLKRRSILGTFVGGVAGAIPPVVGYCAASNQLDFTALALFMILFIWQLPHAYAIAIYRMKDYQAANIPVLPVIKGLSYTKIMMVCLIPIFMITTWMPFLLGNKGIEYLVAASIVGVLWLVLGILGLWTQDIHKWARRMFLFSIVVIVALCIMLIV